MTTLVLPNRLTLTQATACLAQLVERLQAESDPTVVVDASALEQFDSAALALLLACRRECTALGRAFAVRALPERLQSLAALYGIEELLPAA
jgi:phospholipid transport system transporter-binding protein